MNLDLNDISGVSIHTNEAKNMDSTLILLIYYLEGENVINEFWSKTNKLIWKIRKATLEDVKNLDIFA